MCRWAGLESPEVEVLGVVAPGGREEEAECGDAEVGDAEVGMRVTAIGSGGGFETG